MKTNSTVILNIFRDKSQFGNYSGFITRKYPDGVVLNSGKSIPFYGANQVELEAKMRSHVRATYFGAYDIKVQRGSDGHSIDREVSVRSELTFDSNHS